MTSDSPYSPDGVKNTSFVRNKYGKELLIDVAWIHEMPTFEKSTSPYRLDFYDITIITSGSGSFWLDNTEYKISPNTVFFTSPGQVRRWFVDNLDGQCLFFPAEFLLEHFNDSLFLHRLRYFHANSGPYSLTITPQQQARLTERLQTMHQEIKCLSSDSPHLLRAIAYEILVNLNRWYAAQYGQQLDSISDQTVSSFRLLIETEFRKKLGVADYADRMGITPGHLNYLCKIHLGSTASGLIRGRMVSEACRLLVHTEQGIGTISAYLGFSDPSYFSRAFRREKSISPKEYRTIGQKRLSD